MQILGMQRHQTIESLTTQQAGLAVDASIALWVRVASQIILLVGEGGFDSLYSRSVFLSQSTFPWLAIEAATAPSDQRFGSLAASLQAQPKELVNQANCLLLVTMTDILASLIGEPLTASILEAAWGSDDRIHTDEEQKK